MENVFEEHHVQKKNRKKGECTIQQEMKLRRSKGLAYITKKKQIVSAKEEPSTRAICKCKNECKTISPDWKLKLFADFYNLEDNVKQNNLLMGLLILIPVKRRRHGNYTNEKDSRRQCTICFTLPNEGGGVFSVCKQTFLDTFSINKRRVETLVSAKKLGMTSYTEKEVIN
ncbi:hypothetical protein J6590_058282 [Homalodisca vitripennis]|nr:hypothetical protein J6590_058282 [Homalodisca vitripennis]